MATRIKCHTGSCGSCSLCRTRGSKYTHPKRFTSQQYEFLCKLEERDVDKSACICYPCHKQIQRNVDKDNFYHVGEREIIRRLIDVALPTVKQKCAK